MGQGSILLVISAVPFDCHTGCHYRITVGEAHFSAGKIPCLALVRGTLIVQEYLACGGIVKDIGMTGFTGVPCLFVAGAKERGVKHSGEVYPVIGGGNADLLRPAVVRTGVEHVYLIVIHHGGGGFDAFSFPVQGRFQNGVGHALGEVLSVPAGICRRTGHAQLLDLHFMIPCSKVQEQLVFEDAHIRINGTSAAPIICGTEDGVGGILFKVQSVRGDSMADGVGFPVAVGLVEQVHFSVLHDGSRRAVTVLFSFTGVIQGKKGFVGPVFSVGGGGDTDAQAFVIRNFCGIIEEIPALEKYNSRVFGKFIVGE